MPHANGVPTFAYIKQLKVDYINDMLRIKNTNFNYKDFDYAINKFYMDVASGKFAVSQGPILTEVDYQQATQNAEKIINRTAREYGYHA